MKFTDSFTQEINMLILFNTSNQQEGIKVHNSAGASSVETASRLFDKGLITQKDGGYLTNLGADAAENAHALLTILSTEHSN